jgi:hypothetical protein
MRILTCVEAGIIPRIGQAQPPMYDISTLGRSTVFSERISE